MESKQGTGRLFSKAEAEDLSVCFASHGETLTFPLPTCAFTCRGSAALCTRPACVVRAVTRGGGCFSLGLFLGEE